MQDYKKSINEKGNYFSNLLHAKIFQKHRFSINIECSLIHPLLSLKFFFRQALQLSLQLKYIFFREASHRFKDGFWLFILRFKSWHGLRLFSAQPFLSNTKTQMVRVQSLVLYNIVRWFSFVPSRFQAIFRLFQCCQCRNHLSYMKHL